MMSFLAKIKRIRNQLKEKGKHFSVFGVSIHKSVASPSLTEEQIQAFEQEHYIRLPEDYRQFLLQVGYGNYGLLTLEEALINHKHGFLSSPFPYASGWNEYPQSDEDSEAYLDDAHVQGTLRLYYESDGYYDFLVITGVERGNVWVDARVNDLGLIPLSHPVTNAPRVNFSEWYKAYLGRY